MTAFRMPACCARILSDIASPDGTVCECCLCGCEWTRVKGKGWKMTVPPVDRPRVVCMYCGTTKSPGTEPVSHGCCTACRPRFLADLELTEEEETM